MVTLEFDKSDIHYLVNNWERHYYSFVIGWNGGGYPLKRYSDKELLRAYSDRQVYIEYEGKSLTFSEDEFTVIQGDSVVWDEGDEIAVFLHPEWIFIWGIYPRQEKGDFPKIIGKISRPCH